MKTDHEMIRVKLENMRARAIRERAELVARIAKIDHGQKLTDLLLAAMEVKDSEPT